MWTISRSRVKEFLKGWQVFFARQQNALPPKDNENVHILILVASEGNTPLTDRHFQGSSGSSEPL
ncbi:MAG: hypothetical protein IPN28_00010 [Alphaproteobacteria bacterium]|nr:MAG: hypothetical protein IPN28_00010 [Alphaproteobacteria bacterium]